MGLCICFYDLLSSSEGLIGHGEGNVHVNGISKQAALLLGNIGIVFTRADQQCTVEFRLIVFRPFRGEILEGTIVDAEPSGMRCRTPTQLFYAKLIR